MTLQKLPPPDRIDLDIETAGESFGIQGHALNPLLSV